MANKPRVHDNPYKLGCALIDRRERLVVVLDRSPTLALDQPGPHGEEPPADLRAALDRWDEWSPRFDAVAAGGWPATPVMLAGEDWRLPRLGDKCLCIGANYTDHIAEMDVARPPWPYSFVVPPSTAVTLSGTPVQIPRGVESWDWEAEVAVVLGRRLRYAEPEEAIEAVALYVPLNDLSARDAGTVKIAMGIDMTMVKAHDNSKVIGRVLTPAQFVADPQNLWLNCKVNGQLKQDLTTATMIYSVAECVAHLSTIMTLMPGDLIATGTGGGVGILRDPPEVLHDGDVVEVEVEGLGIARTLIVGAERPACGE